MQITFLRHGIADTTSPEELRALTPEGREQIEGLFRQLQKSGEKYDLIVSSPLLRTQQTAEIIANALGMKERLILDPRLACGCHLGDVQAVLQDHRDAQKILVVGHSPDLGLIASELLGLAQPLEFQRGSLLKLKAQFLRPGSATLLSFIHPWMA